MSSTFAEARAAYAGGGYDVAMTHLNALLSAGGASDEDVVCLLGETMAKLGMTAEAAEVFEHAAGLGGERMAVHFHRAACLHEESGRDDLALVCCLKAQRIDPRHPDIAFLLITLLRRSGDAALVEQLKFTLVASETPKHLELALELIGADRWDARSLVLMRKLRQLHPKNMVYRNAVVTLAREFCDFDVLDAEEARLSPAKWRARADWVALETPHDNLHDCDIEAVNRLARNAETIGSLGGAAAARRRRQNHSWGDRRGDRIRVGYLSADFFDTHATMRLLGDVLRRHDARRFEITLFCHTPARLTATPAAQAARRRWGRIVEIGDLDDAAAAARIRDEGIDILVDLKGHTAHSRATILNHAAAPVQATWLGFPGSVVEIDLDYVIGDHVVTPDSSRPFYHEKFCRLPETYQPNDPTTRDLPAPALRSDLGLPEDGFVFASFNGAAKIGRHIIALWAKILEGTPRSVLWLMCTSQAMMENVTHRFARLGITRDRLIFAPALPHAKHVARLQAADLALDTSPVNGHTTTSDMLWAGLPVVTMKGRNFASRVSESLLRAAGLAELTAASDEDYVRLAIALAGDPGRLASIKRRLVENRFQAPLFDSERFCRHLESGYESMAERARAGKAPDHFDVPALPPRAGSFKPLDGERVA